MIYQIKKYLYIFTILYFNYNYIFIFQKTQYNIRGYYKNRIQQRIRVNINLV